MIGHYTINIPEIFQVLEQFSEFDRDAVRGRGVGGRRDFLKGWIFLKGEQGPTHLL